MAMSSLLVYRGSLWHHYVVMNAAVRFVAGLGPRRDHVTAAWHELHLQASSQERRCSDLHTYYVIL